MNTSEILNEINDPGTLRSLQSLFNKILTEKGSVGSDNIKTVRDGQSIQSVIDSITDASVDNPHVVIVPPGSHVISATIKIPSHIILDLTNASFVFDSTTDMNLFENEDLINGNENITIRGGRIDGQRGEYNSECPGYCCQTGCGFYIKSVNNLKITGTFFKDCAGPAISVESDTNGIITECEATNCCGYGMFELTTTVNFTVSHCYLHDARWNGVNVCTGDIGTKVLFNEIIDCPSSGITMCSPGDGFTIIHGNHVKSPNVSSIGKAISGCASTYTIITDNFCEDGLRACIDFQGPRVDFTGKDYAYVTIRGNICEGHSSTPHGIRIANNGGGYDKMILVCENNIIKNVTSEDIFFVHGADTDILPETIIKDNISKDNAVGTWTLTHFGATEINSSAGAVTGTLPDGFSVGERKIIVMTDQTTSSTVTVTHLATSDGGDGEVATFDAVDETWILEWTGTEWVTIYATCTFV